MTDDLHETAAGPVQEGRRAGQQVRRPGGSDRLLQCRQRLRVRAARGEYGPPPVRGGDRGQRGRGPSSEGGDGEHRESSKEKAVLAVHKDDQMYVNQLLQISENLKT
ncbi:hypothetical protein RJ640_011179 [Escallonia rubra]|uniref:Uncharacterized protein n=1 Tax=Escallonia rubra TaxID=112253 RepID=A0AA88S1V0_9ASTE|nr:hypothetical protein RJ640_011179 [Escallonia rubra]